MYYNFKLLLVFQPRSHHPFIHPSVDRKHECKISGQISLFVQLSLFKMYVNYW